MADGVNLITNGSFENIDVSRYGRHHGHHHGRHHHVDLIGWQTSQGPGPHIKGDPWWPASDGRRFIELDGHGRGATNSAIFQDVATDSAASFVLSFDFAPRPFNPGSSNGIEVIWDGQVIDTITADGGWGMDWQTFTYELEGAGDLTRLEFRAVGRNDGRGGFLDNVSLVAQDPPPLFTDDGDTVVLADDDLLRSEGGADTLVGGAGVDVMIGKGGADRFVFDLAAMQAESGIGAGNRNIIEDFDATEDLIELSGVVSFNFVGD